MQFEWRSIGIQAFHMNILFHLWMFSFNIFFILLIGRCCCCAFNAQSQQCAALKYRTDWNGNSRKLFCAVFNSNKIEENRPNGEQNVECEFIYVLNIEKTLKLVDKYLETVYY